MTITAAQVKELRERTGLGMMECKGALTETQGDMNAAIDLLRKKAGSKVEKKAGRTASEGAIGGYARPGGQRPGGELCAWPQDRRAGGNERR